jgi:hypothetical protein
MDPATDISFGQYALPVILMVILTLIYKFKTFTDRYKSLIAVCVGIVLGLVAIPYNGVPFTVVNIVDYGLYGLMIGASATGLYELQRTVTKPRA